MTDIVNPVWSIYDATPEDNSINEYEYVEYRDVDVQVQNKDNFMIDTKDKDLYLLMSKAYLEVRFKLAKADGTPIATANTIAAVNDGYNLFRRAVLLMEDKTISEVEPVGKAHLIKSIVNYSKDYANSVGTNQFFYVDSTSDGNADKTFLNLKGSMAPSALADNVVGTINTGFNGVNAFFSGTRGGFYNTGFESRFDRHGALGNDLVTLYLPLCEIFPILKDWGRVFRGIRHTVRLYQETTYQNAIYGETVTARTSDNPKTIISYVSMWVPALKPSLSVMDTLEKQLSAGSKNMIKWNDMKIYKNTTFPAASTDNRWRITTEVNKPVKIYVAFAYRTRGTVYNRNSQQFDLIPLSRMHVRLNTKQFPKEEYNFADRGLVRAYRDFLEMGNHLFDYDNGSCISFPQYRDIYPIFCFDISHQDPTLFDQQGSADIELRFTLSAPAAADYDVYALIEYEKQVEFDSKNASMIIKG